MPETSSLKQLFPSASLDDQTSDSKFNKSAAFGLIGVCATITLSTIFFIMPKIVSQKTKNLTEAANATKNKKDNAEKQIAADLQQCNIQLQNNADAEDTQYKNTATENQKTLDELAIKVQEAEKNKTDKKNNSKHQELLAELDILSEPLMKIKKQNFEIVKAKHAEFQDKIADRKQEIKDADAILRKKVETSSKKSFFQPVTHFFGYK